MILLKVTEDRFNEMNEKGIVICTYISISGEEINAISIEFKSDFPELEEVEVIINNEI